MGAVLAPFCPHRNARSVARDRRDRYAERQKWRAEFAANGYGGEFDERLARLFPDGPPLSKPKLSNLKNSWPDPQPHHKPWESSAPQAERCPPMQPPSAPHKTGIEAELARLRRELGAELGFSHNLIPESPASEFSMEGLRQRVAKQASPETAQRSNQSQRVGMQSNPDLVQRSFHDQRGVTHATHETSQRSSHDQRVAMHPAPEMIQRNGHDQRAAMHAAPEMFQRNGHDQRGAMHAAPEMVQRNGHDKRAAMHPAPEMGQHNGHDQRTTMHAAPNVIQRSNQGQRAAMQSTPETLHRSSPGQPAAMQATPQTIQRSSHGQDVAMQVQPDMVQRKNQNHNQRVATQATPETVQYASHDKPKKDTSPKSIISEKEIQKLQRQAVGNTQVAWVAYERLLQACEPHHYWCWMPDGRLADFWRSLTAKDQAEITEVQSKGFRDLMQEHAKLQNTYNRNFVAASKEVGILDEKHCIPFLQKFFCIAVNEDVSIAIDWQTVEAIDGMIQGSIRADNQVDPSKLPHGSREWCQHKEREHTRLALMCMVPEIFERRLLGRWERKHGATAKRRQEAMANGQKNPSSSESSSDRHIRLVLEHLKARAAKKDEVMNTQESAKVIKKLSQEMKEGLASSMGRLEAALELSQHVAAHTPAAERASEDLSQRVVMQGAADTGQRRGDEKPRSNSSPKITLSQSQVTKLQRQANGDTVGAWLASEKLLHACESYHFWSWVPDRRITNFWHTLPAKDQAEITEVESRGFRDHMQEHAGFRTCYCKTFLTASKEPNLLDDGHSIPFLQEFFRIAVSDGVCIALNWETMETVDEMIQSSINADSHVDESKLKEGSREWCQHKEREHNRIALMCMVPEIFERRLLSRWERHQHLRRKEEERSHQALTNERKKNTNTESASAKHNRLVVEHLKSRTARAAVEVVETQKAAKVIKKLCLKLEEGLASATSSNS